MLISDASTRALDAIAQRQRDLESVFTPGAQPENTDVFRVPGSSVSQDPLSVAAPQEAYFVTRGARGEMLYTRDGSFSFSGGVLRDASGLPVLGYDGTGTPLAPLQADPVDVALGAISQPRIAPDGSVTVERTVVDPQTHAHERTSVSLGRIALARFTAGTKLDRIDAAHASSQFAPHLGTPADGNFAAVAPFARSSSAIDLDLGLQRLQDAYLAFDAVSAAGKAQGNLSKTAMDLLK